VRRVLHMVREEQQGSEDEAEGAKPSADATKADKVGLGLQGRRASTP
jgi:hypothetical protein